MEKFSALNNIMQNFLFLVGGPQQHPFSLRHCFWLYSLPWCVWDNSRAHFVSQLGSLSGRLDHGVDTLAVAVVTATHVVGYGRIFLRNAPLLEWSDLPTSMCIQDYVVVSHARCKIGIQAHSPAIWIIHTSFGDDQAPFDHSVEVVHTAVFQNCEICRKFIHVILVDCPVSTEYDVALATRQPGDLAHPAMYYTIMIGTRSTAMWLV